jgi:hypothetical protein
MGSAHRSRGVCAERSRRLLRYHCYGSGDYEDPPEVTNDLQRETFYIQYGSTAQRGVFNAGGTSYPSLAEAVAGAESAPGIGSTIRWKTSTTGEA